MTDDERDDLIAEYAAEYVAAVQRADIDAQQRIVGSWDGKTGAPASWVTSILELLDAVVHMIPSARVDWAAIEDAMTGNFPLEALTPIGKHEVIARLAREGLSDQQIADRIGMTKSAVCQYRTRHGIPAGAPLCNRASA